MSGGWTVVDSITNKSVPMGGTVNTNTASAYFTPSPGQQDPVGKFRTSSPQALIDTDFEYGTQPTKWESIALQQNRQSVYYIPQQPRVITSIESSGTTTVVVLMASTAGFSVGSSIYVQNSSSALANGWYLVSAVNAGVSVSYIVPTAPPAGNQFNAALTYVYLGYFYSGCGFQLSGTTAFTTDGSTSVFCTTTNAHGLVRGNLVYVVGTTSSGTTINGAQVVATTPTANTFTFININGAVAAAAITNAAGTTNLFARPAGFTEPRTFDGGVAFSAGGAVPNQQLIRQTRRYFRYQSGKGIQFSTGSCMRPALFVTSLTGSGTTATVTSRYQHNLAVGATIEVVGADQGAYNGRFTIATVPSPTTLTYTTQISVGASTTATGVAIRISPLNWYGSANRVGMFDQQNGMFFEYDGQQLYAVLRNSINQLNGTVAVTQGSNIVTGTATQFSTQLQPGTFIVLRGQSYKVVTIASDTSMQISPEYRGTSLTGALASITLEVRIPQSKWTDPCNGTGPSGYNIDLSRMQMWYIDYSWYGAGVIRYGFRGSSGQITYVTQIQNNNIQFEAYMRSGNMAAHYESNAVVPMTMLSANLGNTSTTTTAAVTATDTTIPLTSAAGFNNVGVVAIGTELIYYASVSGNNLINCIRGFNRTNTANYTVGATVSVSSIDVLNPSQFPPTGTVKVTAAGGSGVSEYIAYTGNDGSLLYGLTRAQTGGQATAQSFTFSATAPIGVELITPTTVPSLSHWGSSVIMDGRYDDDKSLIFNYGTTTAISTSSTSPIVIMAIRVAPAADNGSIGLLGQKEIINRMQLQLDSLGLYTTGTGYLINLIMNGFASGAISGSFITPIQQANGITSSLAQIAVNTNAVTVTGGESVFAAYSNTSGNTTLDLSQVRDLGNSILGGGTSNTVPTTQAGFYPDGPDILYIVATPLSATTSTILARLNWKEAQA